MSQSVLDALADAQTLIHAAAAYGLLTEVDCYGEIAALQAECKCVECCLLAPRMARVAAHEAFRAVPELRG